MKKWEYKVEEPVDTNDRQEVNWINPNSRAEDLYLSKMGESGWELVNVSNEDGRSNWMYHWKRELISKPELEKI